MGVKRLVGMVWPQLPEPLSDMDGIDSETLCERTNVYLGRSSDTQHMLAPLKNCTILEKEPADGSYRYDTERLKRTRLEAKASSLRQPGKNLTYPHYLGGMPITKDKLNAETACSQ